MRGRRARVHLHVSRRRESRAERVYGVQSRTAHREIARLRQLGNRGRWVRSQRRDDEPLGRSPLEIAPLVVRSGQDERRAPRDAELGRHVARREWCVAGDHHQRVRRSAKQLERGRAGGFRPTRERGKPAKVEVRFRLVATHLTRRRGRFRRGGVRAAERVVARRRAQRHDAIPRRRERPVRVVVSLRDDPKASPHGLRRALRHAPVRPPAHVRRANDRGHAPKFGGEEMTSQRARRWRRGRRSRACFARLRADADADADGSSGDVAIDASPPGARGGGAFERIADGRAAPRGGGLERVARPEDHRSDRIRGWRGERGGRLRGRIRPRGGRLRDADESQIVGGERSRLVEAAHVHLARARDSEGFRAEDAHLGERDEGGVDGDGHLHREFGGHDAREDHHDVEEEFASISRRVRESVDEHRPRRHEREREEHQDEHRRLARVGGDALAGEENRSRQLALRRREPRSKHHGETPAVRRLMTKPRPRTVIVAARGGHHPRAPEQHVLSIRGEPQELVRVPRRDGKLTRGLRLPGEHRLRRRRLPSHQQQIARHDGTRVVHVHIVTVIVRARADETIASPSCS